jgi:hypothetical protein
VLCDRLKKHAFGAMAWHIARSRGGFAEPTDQDRLDFVLVNDGGAAERSGDQESPSVIIARDLAVQAV